MTNPGQLPDTITTLLGVIGATQFVESDIVPLYAQALLEEWERSNRVNSAILARADKDALDRVKDAAWSLATEQWENRDA